MIYFNLFILYVILAGVNFSIAYRTKKRILRVYAYFVGSLCIVIALALLIK